MITKKNYSMEFTIIFYGESTLLWKVCDMTELYLVGQKSLDVTGKIFI